MTQPPEHDPTRRMDPLDETAAYEMSDPTHAYDQHQQPYEQPYQTAYGQQPYTGGAYPDQQHPGQPYPDQPATSGGEPPVTPPRKNTGRTVGLSLAIVLALIVIGFVGYLIVDKNRSPAPGVAIVSESATDSTTTSATTSSPTSTSTQTSTPTTPAVPVGQVTYKISGDGDVLGLRYRTGNSSQFVPAVGAPWSQVAQAGERAELTALVVRGKVTCSIMHGDKVLSTSTSAGGTLMCQANLSPEN